MSSLDLDALEKALAAMMPPWFGFETRRLVNFRQEIIAIVNAAPQLIARIRELEVVLEGRNARTH